MKGFVTYDAVSERDASDWSESETRSGDPREGRRRSGSGVKQSGHCVSKPLDSMLNFRLGFLFICIYFFFISFHLFFTAFACLSFSSQDIPKNLLKIIFPPL